MAALRAAFDLSVDEAWASYRLVKAALDHSPALADLDRHPRIVAREVRDARLALVGAEKPATVTDVVQRREQEYDELIEEEYVEFEFSADTEGGT